jgi:2-haloacid dehalogenase
MSTTERWVSFDCYGTLIDWRTGMEQALASIAEPDSARRLFEGYHRHEHALQQARPIKPYRTVLTEGLRAAAQDAGIGLAEESASVLADTLPTWPAFGETETVLRRLRADGWRLAVLSNVDNTMIEQTLKLIGVPVDVVITSEDVGSYKPDPGHFLALQDRTGADAGSWVHVACSWFHDVVPTSALGVRSVFVNREAEERDTSLASAVLPDLIGLDATLREILR